MNQQSKKTLKALQKHKLFKDLERVFSLIEAEGEEVYVVGGAVRNALLGYPVSDIDLTTSCSPKKLLKIFKDFKVLKHGIDFGTVVLVLEEGELEITCYRGEEVYKNHRSPNKLSFSKDKLEDLKRRDFTVNALLFSFNEGVVDPFGFLKDLERKTLKAIADPKKRFEEDALRILRLFRLSLNYSFSIEEETLKAALDQVHLLKHISSERIASEIEKTFAKPVEVSVLEQHLNEFGFRLNHPFKNTLKFSFLEQGFLLYLMSKKVLMARVFVRKKVKSLISFYTYIDDESSIDLIKDAFIRYSKQNNLDYKDLDFLWSSISYLKDFIKGDELVAGLDFNLSQHREKIAKAIKGLDEKEIKVRVRDLERAFYFRV